jgi:hypothetical protein
MRPRLLMIAKRNHGSQVVHKTGCQNGLPEICDVEPQLQHDSVNDSDGGCVTIPHVSD